MGIDHRFTWRHPSRRAWLGAWDWGGVVVGSEAGPEPSRSRAAVGTPSPAPAPWS